MSTPTPAQLASAGLVQVSSLQDIMTAEKNNYPARTFDAIHGKFPPIVSAYVSKNWKTPLVPPSIYPSGKAPLPVASGYTRAASEDFTSNAWSSLWTGRYNGQSGGCQPGIFLSSHAVLKGDSLLRLEAYPDPSGAVGAWDVTPALIATVNGWAGAGVQTQTRWPVGTTFTWAMMWDTYPEIASIALTMGNTWPPEQDIVESSNGNPRGSSVTSLTDSFHYTQSNGQIQLSFTGQDFSKWHVWQLKWTKTGSIVTCDGNVVVNLVYTPEMIADATYGLLANQFFSFQCQTGDCGNPPADSTITSANPITTYVDWITIDTPSDALHMISRAKDEEIFIPKLHRAA